MKIKESEMSENTWIRELKKQQLWNIKATVVTIVIGALGMEKNDLRNWKSVEE